ncbi:MAG: hypothetical protein Q7T57_01200, partial [Dehalococcoidales bacterium]|nr:hypothetical protein [Dehalococcoidales bacterium]
MSARSTGTGGAESKSASIGSRTARGQQQQQRSYGASAASAWPIITEQQPQPMMYSSSIIPVASQPFVETTYLQPQVKTQLFQPQAPQPQSFNLETQQRFLQTQHSQQLAAADEAIKSKASSSFAATRSAGGEQKWQPQSPPSYHKTLPHNSSYLESSNTYR